MSAHDFLTVAGNTFRLVQLPCGRWIAERAEPHSCDVRLFVDRDSLVDVLVREGSPAAAETDEEWRARLWREAEDERVRRVALLDERDEHRRLGGHEAAPAPGATLTMEEDEFRRLWFRIAPDSRQCRSAGDRHDEIVEVVLDLMGRSRRLAEQGSQLREAGEFTLWVGRWVTQGSSYAGPVDMTGLDEDLRDIQTKFARWIARATIFPNRAPSAGKSGEHPRPVRDSTMLADAALRRDYAEHLAAQGGEAKAKAKLLGVVDAEVAGEYGRDRKTLERIRTRKRKRRSSSN
jgi:hypothetical protein